MSTLDKYVRPNGNSFAEGRLNPLAELWAPPLAPNGTTAAENVFCAKILFFCAKTLFAPKLRSKILSSLLRRVIHTKRFDPGES